jgi:hypothetical protein
MPRYKVLKGVAHNIGHSFTSLMNYAIDDYTMGHILRLARKSGKDTLIIDFITGVGRPAELLQEPGRTQELGLCTVGPPSGGGPHRGSGVVTVRAEITK